MIAIKNDTLVFVKYLIKNKKIVKDLIEFIVNQKGDLS
jgi:hypothetical protein